MVADSVAATINELEQKRAALGERMAFHQRAGAEAANELQHIDNALRALKALPTSGADGGDSPEWEMGRPPRDAESHTVPKLNPDIPPGPSRLIPFAGRAVGQDRDGLRSPHMVAAMVDYLAAPVTQERLQKAFFTYFDHDLLSSYWKQPERSFRTALQRAVEREMVTKITYPGDQGTVYMSGFRVVGG